MSFYASSDSLTSSSTVSRPRVVIVGAGLGGLTLGLLLERADIPYTIVERTPVVKPLGSALALGDNVAPLFKQLGIYDDLIDASVVLNKIVVRDKHANPDYAVDFSPSAALGGAPQRIISRPAIFNILFHRIPRGKILFNKRVLSVQTDEKGVRVICADKSEYEADIVVGADGANSAVRQTMYKELQEQGRLPPADAEPLPYSCMCLVGQTTPLDSQVFPEVKEEECQSNRMVGVDNMFTWTTFTTRYKTICWMVVLFLDKTTIKVHDTIRTSEWGPEAAAAMSKQVRDFPIANGPPGSTLGTLLDLTPKELISKVTLEEKVFKTWYSRRTVLLGDASHKAIPYGGSGAATAMQDAVCLANWINVLPSTDEKELETMFKDYVQERYPVALEVFHKSQLYAAACSKNFKGAMARYIQKRIPRWLWISILKKSAKNRPQISFLPLVQDHGKYPPAPQPSLTRTLEILQEQGRNVQAIVI
ncbi:hypothetical protein BGZ83_005018 [Gryganskiella cystojenkinii]|nr:hypothetical protein BGZ83_005018 [Gryganskiella cystojenkinii]